MSAPFPANEPFLQGNFAPLLIEADAYDLPVVGEIPAELSGTLYRNGPNPQFAPRGFYHWFAGDGMLHALRVQNGRVAYRNRWVRTLKWQMEHEAGKALFGAFGNPMWSDPVTFGKDSTLANTNVVWHGGKLLALEEAHLPFEVDADTLEPKGEQSFGGRLKTRMTAHPKIDPETGEMVCFAYSAAGRFTPTMAYYTIDRSGALTDYQQFEAPYVSMVHDFCVTKDFVLFPILPLTGSIERAMGGKPAFAWEPDKGNRIGILKRGEKADSIRWFAGDPSYVFHPMNAHDLPDGRIVLDVVRHPSMFRTDMRGPNEGNPTLDRWTVDPVAGTVHEETLDDHPLELPRVDERLVGKPARYGYATTFDGSTGGIEFGPLLRYDGQAGTSVLHDYGPGRTSMEAVFVPRTPDAAEDDGWVMSVVYDAAEDASQLVLLNGQDFTGEPACTIQLPDRVPFGFHGNWVGD